MKAEIAFFMQITENQVHLVRESDGETLRIPLTEILPLLGKGPRSRYLKLDISGQPERDLTLDCSSIIMAQDRFEKIKAAVNAI